MLILGQRLCLGREVWIINQLYQNNLCFQGLDEQVFCAFIQLSGKITRQTGLRQWFALEIHLQIIPSTQTAPSPLI
jgi:hypothetical protein